MKFKVEVLADSSGVWAGNMLRYVSWVDARSAALDLAMRWTAVREWRVTTAEDVEHANVLSRQIAALSGTIVALEVGAMLFPKGVLMDIVAHLHALHLVAAGKIEFTREKRDALRNDYQLAVQRGQESFMFEGQEILVAYAKYLLEYLDGVFGVQ